MGTKITGRPQRGLIIVLAALNVLAGGAQADCGDADSNTRKNPSWNAGIRKIVYRFADASVPPEYHRSFRIAVTCRQATVTVDCYGEILAEKAFDIDHRDFEALVRALSRCGIRREDLGGASGCTGGTAQSIVCSDDAGEVFRGRLYRCGGADSGNLGGDVDAFAQEVAELIPDLQTLLR